MENVAVERFVRQANGMGDQYASSEPRYYTELKTVQLTILQTITSIFDAT
jgi:hypothetical protein